MEVTPNPQIIGLPHDQRELHPCLALPIHHVTTCASRWQKVGCDGDGGDETRPKVVSTALSTQPLCHIPGPNYWA